MQTFSIAPASADDCLECARLLVEQLRGHGIDSSAEQLARVLADVVADMSRGFLLVARAGGRVVGVAYVATILSVEHCGPVGWLEEIYVTPDCRNRGIGTSLVAAVIKRAEEAAIAAIDLEIDAAHSRAASLYQRFGFLRLDRSRWVRKLKR
ncbi:MAG: GNAT family N-acetyltransferase [Desulfomonile tiedjei]|nr:GNAT family N-acetyltransferase [Desulfomonile tiedjei]